uniref:Citrate-binding protein-like n=1 Tax=Populus alba TaxID=43335 RepID=A0A4V6ACC5_POPAL|nr:citrate-binding protein-like [Populus alba]
MEILDCSIAWRSAGAISFPLSSSSSIWLVKVLRVSWPLKFKNTSCFQQLVEEEEAIGSKLSDGQKLEKPYDVPEDQRYSFVDGVHKCWVYSTDKPHTLTSQTKPRTEIAIQGYNYSSGVWQFEGYGYVPYGTSGVCIMQVFGASAPRPTTLMVRVYNGSLMYYKGPVLVPNIYDQWFRLNVVHDVDSAKVKVYINGTLKIEADGRGGTSHAFKCGVYAQNNDSYYMESRWKGIKLSTFLLSVDLASTAPHYTKSLFLHVSPSRLSTSDLRNLTAASGGTYIDSLVPNHRLLITNTLAQLNGTVDGSILVNRVRVSVPDLFLGSGIAVHGLDGILVAGFEDKVEDTSFEAATWSPANAIGPADLNSSLAGRFPARRRKGRNHRQNGRNGGIRRNNHRGRRINGGRRHRGGRNVSGGTRGDGVTHGAFAMYNHRL